MQIYIQKLSGHYTRSPFPQDVWVLITSDGTEIGARQSTRKDALIEARAIAEEYSGFTVNTRKPPRAIIEKALPLIDVMNAV